MVFSAYRGEFHIRKREKTPSYCPQNFIGIVTNTHSFAYIRTYTNIHVCAYVHTCIHMYSYVQIHIWYMYKYIGLFIYLFMDVYDNIFQRSDSHNIYYVGNTQINCFWPKVRTATWHIFMTIRISGCLKESVQHDYHEKGHRS